jgi:hypothetical protein
MNNIVKMKHVDTGKIYEVEYKVVKNEVGKYVREYTFPKGTPYGQFRIVPEDSTNG